MPPPAADMPPVESTGWEGALSRDHREVGFETLADVVPEEVAQQPPRRARSSPIGSWVARNFRTPEWGRAEVPAGCWCGGYSGGWLSVEVLRCGWVGPVGSAGWAVTADVEGMARSSSPSRWVVPLKVTSPSHRKPAAPVGRGRSHGRDATAGRHPSWSREQRERMTPRGTSYVSVARATRTYDVPGRAQAPCRRRPKVGLSRRAIQDASITLCPTPTVTQKRAPSLVVIRGSARGRDAGSP